MPDALLWVVWDGASHEIVQELLKRGRLPALARVVADGGLAPVAPTFPNCQTPTSLASLFTGESPDRHGICGFAVPTVHAGTTIVEHRSAFAPGMLREPTVWHRASSIGMPVGLSHLPWSEGTDGVRCEAYPHHVADPVVTPVVGSTQIHLGGRSIGIDVDGDVAALHCDGKFVRSARIADQLWEDAIDVQLAPTTATRIGAWRNPDDRIVRVVASGAWTIKKTVHEAPCVEGLVEPFIGRALGDQYRAGALGARAVDGGRGGAELALEASLRHQARCFAAHSAWTVRAAEGFPLCVTYQPVIDEAQHELFRWWYDDGPGADAARRVLVAAYDSADRELAELLALCGARRRVVVSSDHGALAVRRSWWVNETLASAGLLRFGADGAIELPGTSIAYHPARNGSLWVNSMERAGGIVHEAARASVLARASAALREATDGATGLPAARAILPLDVDAVNAIGWDPRWGDLFLVARDGYDVRADRSPDGREIAPTNKGGVHVTPSGSLSLHGIVAGADVDGPDVVPMTRVLTAATLASGIRGVLREAR